MTSLHPDRLVNLIKKHNVEVGVALNPATSLTSLDYLSAFAGLRFADAD
ncbi:hypothetical protein ACLB1Q_23725 [Escherichia coli]